MNRTLLMGGKLSTKVMREPKASLSWRIKNAIRPGFIFGYLANQTARLFTKLTGIPTLIAELRIRHFDADGNVTNYGTVGYKVVTTAFVNYMTDSLQSTQADWVNFKYHASGTDNTAEAIANTTLGVEVEASRATGTQTEGATNIYESVGTISYTATRSIVEHGLFNATSSGTLMDRTVFGAISVNNGDSIEFTYDLTCTAGG